MSKKKCGKFINIFLVDPLLDAQFVLQDRDSSKREKGRKAISVDM
jgi:hypothetical protein